MNNTNIITAVNKINNMVKETNVREAILAHLSEIAATLPGGKMPNGYSAEEAADEILNTATTYTEARNARVTKDELHRMIAKHCESMTSEQAAEYLAGLHVFYKNLSNVGAGISQEQLVEEVRGLAENSSNIPMAEHIDALLETLDPENLPSIFGFVHEIELNGEPAAVNAEYVENRLGRHFDAQQNAIHAAAMYGEAVQGNLEDVAPDANPGMITANACASADAARVALQAQAGQITEEEATEELNLIERAFMAALAALWAAIYVNAGLNIALVVGLAMTSIGLPTGLAFLVGTVIILGVMDGMFDEFDGAYETATSIYIWLRKKTRPFRTKVGGYINTAFQTGKNFVANLGKA